MASAERRPPRPNFGSHLRRLFGGFSGGWHRQGPLAHTAVRFLSAVSARRQLHTGLHVAFHLHTTTGTLTFNLSKHVGAGRAMALMSLKAPLGAEEALRIGAVQHVAETAEGLPQIRLQVQSCTPLQALHRTAPRTYLHRAPHCAQHDANTMHNTM